MGALRDRMIRDMTVRGFSPRTHESYIQQVIGLAKYYRRPPDQLSDDDVQAYLAMLFTEHRLVAFADGHVRFRWRDYADADRVKIMALGVDEFLRRFLLHIVPDRFVRTRHFGLLANRRRRSMLAQCRTLLACLPPPPVPKESVRDLMLRVTGLDIERCPAFLRRVAVLAPTPTPWDTS